MSSSTSYTGLAAVDQLDALLTSGDFEPEHDVDTVLLDATIDAIAQARAVLRSLSALREHLESGSSDDAATAGLATDARLAVETLDEITAGAIA